MIGEGTVLKVAVVPGVILFATEFVPKVLNAGVQAVIVTAAVLAALGMLGKVARRSWKNGREFIAHIRHGLEIVETAPDRFDKLEATLHEHGETLKQHAKSFDVIADADASRIKDAIAGDERSPVDRRRDAA